MKTEKNFTERMTIQEFADKHHLIMKINERSASLGFPVGSSGRYYANFEDSDIKDGIMLVGAFGDGSTPSMAIANYAAKISEKRLVLRAGTKDRLEIDVPVIVESKNNDL